MIVSLRIGCIDVHKVRYFTVCGCTTYPSVMNRNVSLRKVIEGIELV